MEISLLSGNYITAAHVPAETAEQSGKEPADRSLIVRSGGSPRSPERKPAEDSVEISGSADQGREDKRQYDRNPAGLHYDQSRPRNWDHRLTSWFRTAFAVQGDVPKTTGLRIDILV